MTPTRLAELFARGAESYGYTGETYYAAFADAVNFAAEAAGKPGTTPAEAEFLLAFAGALPTPPAH